MEDETTGCWYCVAFTFFVGSIFWFWNYGFESGMTSITIGGIILLCRYTIDRQGNIRRRRLNRLEVKKYSHRPSRTAKFYEHGERIHIDSWYEDKCVYCSEPIPKHQNTCSFCGHDKRPVEVIEKRSRHISSKVKVEVWRRDYGKCVECGSQERLEYDHIIPFSRGGSNTARNIQLLCENCNRKKHDKI